VYEHLLVPLDGSPAAEHALEHAEALAKAFGSTVTLLRVTDSAQALIVQTAGAGETIGDVGLPIDPTPIVEAESDDAASYLSRVAARLQPHNLTVQTEHFEGLAAEEIVERARALDVSLIVMTTHGRSGLARAVFGSVADSVLRHADCPVLLIRVKTDED